LVFEHEEYVALGPTPAQRQEVYRELCAPPVDPNIAQGIRRLTKRGLSITSETIAEHQWR
jgi:hypothetical protein